MAETTARKTTKLDAEATRVREADGALGRPNGLTDAQVEELLAAAGRRKNDPGYLRRRREGVAEYRRQIQEELERELAAEPTK